MSEIELKKDKKASIMLIGSLIFGIMFQLLFYKRLPGISVTIFIAIFYAVFLKSIKNEIKVTGFSQYVLMIPVILLSLTYALYTDALFMFFNLFFIAALIAANTLLITDNGVYSWYEAGFAADLLKAFFYRPFAYFLKPFFYFGKFMDKRVKKEKYKTVTRILIGFIIAAPILTVVLSLLSSADMIFNSFLGNLTNIFININMGDLLVRIILAGFAALLLFSYLFSLSTKPGRGVSKAPNCEAALGMDPLIIITVLASMDIVYLLFTFIQFTYLFGSINFNLPSGYTYAEYARRGFFELVMVTVINLGLLLAVLNLTKSVGKTVDKILKLMNTVLVGCTFVMLFSAHFRMSLYEDVYGYTYLRLLTHAFMLFIFVLLIIALFKVWYSKLILLKWYVIAAVTAYTIINFVNVNAIVAKSNIERYHSTGKIDVNYMTSLSYEAVPYTSKLYNELKDKDRGSAEILEKHFQYQKTMLEKYNGWQSLNYSRYRAWKIFVSTSGANP